jgi:hypothetical protein
MALQIVGVSQRANCSSRDAGSAAAASLVAVTGVFSEWS